MTDERHDVAEGPPGRFRRKAEEEGISTAQAAAVINRRYGIECDRVDVARALADLGYERYWSTWFVTPEQVEPVAGRIMQRRALWWQKRMVRGDVLVDVEGMIEGDLVVLSVPLERLDDGSREAKETRLYERLPMYEWPTAVLTGWLELVAQAFEEGRARYRLVRA